MSPQKKVPRSDDKADVGDKGKGKAVITPKSSSDSEYDKDLWFSTPEGSDWETDDETPAPTPCKQTARMRTIEPHDDVAEIFRELWAPIPENEIDHDESMDEDSEPEEDPEEVFEEDSDEDGYDGDDDEDLEPDIEDILEHEYNGLDASSENEDEEPMDVDEDHEDEPMDMEENHEMEDHQPHGIEVDGILYDSEGWRFDEEEWDYLGEHEAFPDDPTPPPVDSSDSD